MNRVASEFYVTPFTVPVEPSEGVADLRPRGRFGTGGPRPEVGHAPSAEEDLQANPGAGT